MPIVSCPLGAVCDKGTDGGIWKTDNVTNELVKISIEAHVKYAHQAAAAGAAAATLKAEKLVRPTLQVRDGVIEGEAWEYFVHRWGTYKAQANLTVATKDHLESCLGNEVTQILFGRLGSEGWALLTEETLLQEVKNVFVKKRNRMVNRLKLHNLIQGDEQPVQQYVAVLKQIARTCQFSVECSREDCNTRVDYSQEMVLDQLVRGLQDSEIQRKVLACKEEDFNLDAVEKVVIAEESSKASQKESKATEESGYISALSSYQKNKKLQQQKSAKSCKNCGSSTHNNYWELPEGRKKECKAHKKFCSNCGKPNHIEEVCKETEEGSDKEEDKGLEHNSLMVYDHSSIVDLDAYDKKQLQSLSISSSKILKQNKSNSKSQQPVLHHARLESIQEDRSLIVDIIFDREEYKAQGGKKLGTRPLNLYDHESIADTGADVCCTSPEVAMKMGLKLSETFQSSLQLFAADGRKLSVKGCIPVIINIGTWDKYKSVKEILYFVDGFKNTVLSREALKELGSVSKNFPEIASISLVTSKKLGDDVTNKFNLTKRYSDVLKQNFISFFKFSASLFFGDFASSFIWISVIFWILVCFFLG